MTKLLLDPAFFQGALLVIAILTPVLFLLIGRLRPGFIPRRLLILGAVAGPAALLLWGLHNLVLATVGFDSIWSVAIMLSVAVVVGLAAGVWAGRDSAE